MLGTDKIKEVFASVITIADQFAAILDDGKVSLIELPSIAIATTQIPALVESAKLALPEFKDLTPEEAEEVADFFTLHFDIENDDLESKIEEGVKLISDTYEVVVGGFGLFNRWKSWAESLQAA